MAQSNEQINFFRRTSTYEIFDILYTGKKSFEEIKDAMRQRGHQRQDHDIRYMINTLERIGLIINCEPTEFGLKVKVFVNAIKGNETKQLSHDNQMTLLKIVGKEILKEFFQKGFLLSAFLSALSEKAPNQVIAARFFEEAKKCGFYNINAETDFNDFVPSMKNFAVYLGFADRNDKRGEVVLTALAREILRLEAGTITERKQCQEELCRKICPAAAIYTDYIAGCVKCGLCVRCCPYGAVTCTPSNINFNFELCVMKPKERKVTSCQLSPNLNEIIGLERTMQHWIVNLFRILKLEAIVPGPGTKPDIVLNRKNNATIFECKNEPITGKKVGALKEQLLKYMQQNIIDSTRQYLNLWNFQMKKPDIFFLSAPENSEISQILKNEENLFSFPVSFVSSNAIFELHKAILKHKEVRPDQILELFAEKNIDISSRLISTIST